MKKLISAIIIMFLISSCISQNNRIEIRNYEKCVDYFCLSNIENCLMNLEDVDKYIYDGSLTFFNCEKKIYFRMTHYPGDPKYKMSLFEIGYISTLDTMVFYEYDGLFVTNNHTALGDTVKKIVESHGYPHQISTIKNYKVYQYRVDNSNSKFVQENNEYAYIMEYWFKNGKLVKLIFGFEYP